MMAHLTIHHRELHENDELRALLILVSGFAFITLGSLLVYLYTMQV